MPIPGPDVSVPIEIKRHGHDSVEIRWVDGHISLFPNAYLRENCPCPACRDGKPAGRTLPVLGGNEIFPVQIGVVGRYAISIQWSDRHDSGIYSYKTLRDLCPCETCHTQGSDSV